MDTPLKECQICLKPNQNIIWVNCYMFRIVRGVSCRIRIDSAFYDRSMKPGIVALKNKLNRSSRGYTLISTPGGLQGPSKGAAGPIAYI